VNDAGLSGIFSQVFITMVYSINPQNMQKQTLTDDGIASFAVITYEAVGETP
jgi:hypothetical protein